MSGIMNKYYYGNAGKADYTPDQLPANRLSLFLEMFKLRFGGLCLMSLVITIAALPAIIWSWATFQVVLLDVENAAANSAPLSAVLTPRLTTYCLILIPCLIFYTFFMPGVMYILRNWARDQHTFTASDFKDAVFANWKQSLLLGLINGLSILLTYVGYVVYGSMAENGGAFFYVPQMLLIIICCIWWMANMLIVPMMVTYDMDFRTLVKNSIIMTLSRLPWSLLFWGGSIAIPALVGLFVPYGVAIVGSLYALCLLGMTHFVYASYANSCFDRYLNPRIEGAQVGMGLRSPAHVEEDVTVTDEDIKNL